MVKNGFLPQNGRFQDSEDFVREIQKYLLIHRQEHAIVAQILGGWTLFSLTPTYH